MHQLIYVSSRSPAASSIDMGELLAKSQLNNRRNGITGLLYSDGARFLQVIEGPEAAVDRLVERLGKDSRHRAIVALSRREVAARQFGGWAMARMHAGEDDRSFADRIRTLCRDADARVLGTFLGLIEARSAARA